jgi:hypothetical protein
MIPNLLPLIFLFLVAAAVILGAFSKQPLPGILASLIITGLYMWLSRGGLDELGLAFPASWLQTLLWGLGLGVGLGLLIPLVLEPLADGLMGIPRSLGRREQVRGSWQMLIIWLAISWVLSAAAGETVFRGFVMSVLAGVIGKFGIAAAVSVLVSSVLYGLAHWQEGWSGVIVAGVVGLALGNLFIWDGYNLWLLILVHGFMETIWLVLVYLKFDLKLKQLWIKQA